MLRSKVVVGSGSSITRIADKYASVLASSASSAVRREADTSANPFLSSATRRGSVTRSAATRVLPSLSILARVASEEMISAPAGHLPT